MLITQLLILLSLCAVMQGSSTASISWSQAGLAGLIVGVAVALILILGERLKHLHLMSNTVSVTACSNARPVLWSCSEDQDCSVLILGSNTFSQMRRFLLG